MICFQHCLGSRRWSVSHLIKYQWKDLVRINYEKILQFVANNLLWFDFVLCKHRRITFDRLGLSRDCLIGCNKSKCNFSRLFCNGECDEYFFYLLIVNQYNIVGLGVYEKHFVFTAKIYVLALLIYFYLKKYICHSAITDYPKATTNANFFLLMCNYLATLDKWLNLWPLSLLTTEPCCRFYVHLLHI